MTVDISSTVETSGALERKLKVNVSAEHVAAAMDKAYDKLGRSVKLKGFRKGKVPRSVLQREYGGEVERDVISTVMEEACGHAIEEHELDVVVRPRLLNHDFGPDKGLEFEAAIEVRPEFELGQYKELELDRKVVKVEKAHIDRAIESLRERMAVLETVEDRVNVEGGDILTIDMFGFVEGEAVKGASGEGIQVEVGAGRLPEKLEEGLVGVTRSIKTPILVPFPDDHPDPDIAGRTVRFDVTVREIKTKVLPAVDDDFVADLSWESCDTLADLEEKLRADIGEQFSRDADRRVRGGLLDRLVEAHEFEVPEALVEETIAGYAREMGLSELPEDKREEFRAALGPRATKQVKAGFVLDAVAQAEELEISKDLLRQRIQQEMAVAGERADDVRKYYSLPGAVAELRTRMVREKALDRVFELSTRRDVEVDESQVADSP